jgi:uncharacterized Zn-binding protein involved in type VI secretion
MPPAARVGDQTSHGTPLGPGPGSVNVLIGGMPAWRATADFHACPLATPGTPARQGDVIVESGPPNTITMGCPTVLIG